MVGMLLERGGLAQLQATDENGRVPMHDAAESNPSAEAAGWARVVFVAARNRTQSVYTYVVTVACPCDTVLAP